MALMDPDKPLSSEIIEVLMVNKKHLTSTYLSGKISCTIIIPREIAKKYKIDKPCYVSVEETEAGILVKKVEGY